VRVHPVHLIKPPSAKPPTLRPSQPTWTISLPVEADIYRHWHYIHHGHLLLILSPQDDTHTAVHTDGRGSWDSSTSICCEHWEFLATLRRSCESACCYVRFLVQIYRYDLSYGAISNDLDRPLTSFQPFLSASLYFSKRGAYWDRLCRDVVGRLLSRACTVAKRCILGL